MANNKIKLVYIIANFLYFFSLDYAVLKLFSALNKN